MMETLLLVLGLLLGVACYILAGAFTGVKVYQWLQGVANYQYGGDKITAWWAGGLWPLGAPVCLAIHLAFLALGREE